MHQWIAHFENGIRIVRKECIEEALKDLSGLVVLAHWQGDVEYSYHFTTRRFYRNSEEIGMCQWDARDGLPIAQRQYEVKLQMQNGAPHEQALPALTKTTLGVRLNGEAQFISIMPDNTFTMTIL